jgi:hypothetical protein
MEDALSRTCKHLIGNVYPKKGGRGDHNYWLVISTIGAYAICLGIDKQGEILSCIKYAGYYLENKKPLVKIDVNELRIKHD